MAATVILVEAFPRRASDGAAVPVRLAGGGAIVPYYYGGKHYRAGIVSLPRGTSKLDFDGEQLGGGGVAQALEIQWAPAANAALGEMSALYWTDAPITVRIGAEGDAPPPIVTSGLVLDASIEGGVLKIALADETTDLKRALLVDRFAGTGGIEGPAEWEGRIKSRAWGRCFNVVGSIIDTANNIICFGDPRRRWAGFVAVRDKGAPASADTLTVLGWQGSAEATFAALQAAVATPGGGVLCPSIACIKWWTEPAGDLRADILGEIEGGYVETAPEIAARMIAARSSLTIGAGELEAAVAARPDPYGWYVGDESATAAGEISTIMGDVSLSWLIVDGAVVFRRWEWSAPVKAVRSHGVNRSEVKKPVATRKIGYRKNQSPMQRADLAAIVLIEDLAFPDGDSLVEAIDRAGKTAEWDGVTGDGKPEDDATNGAPAGSLVDGVPAEDVVGALRDGSGNIIHVSDLKDEIAGLIDTYGDTIAADAARQAAELARDATLDAKAAVEAAKTDVDAAVEETSLNASNASVSAAHAALSEASAESLKNQAAAYEALSAGHADDAGNSATASADNASLAGTYKDQAGNSASAANQSKLDAQAANGTAQTAAGTSTAQAVVATNQAAAATAAAQISAQYGAGGNLLNNTEFAAASTTGWNFWTADPTNITWYIDFGDPAWQFAGGHELVVRSNTSASTAAAVFQDFAPVAGHYYCGSVYVGAHRNLASCCLEWRDANATVLGYAQGAIWNDGEAAGGPALSGYKRIYAIGQAPAGAVTGRFVVQHGGTKSGYTDSYLFAVQPMVSEVASLSVQPPPYSPGGGAAVEQALAARISSNETATATGLASAATRTDALEAQVKTGTNYCPDVDQWSVYGGATIVRNFWGLIIWGGQTQTGWFEVALSPPINIGSGVTYTLSADPVMFASDGDASIYFDALGYDANGNLVLDSANSPAAVPNTDFSDARARSTYSVTFTTPANCVTLRVRAVGHRGAGTTVNSMGLRRPKLERGSIATAYSNDAQTSSLSARVTNSEGAIATAEGKLTAWAETIASIPGAEAAIRFLATNADGMPTSKIAIAAQMIALLNDINGQAIPALVVSGGNVLIANDLRGSNGRIIFDNGTVMLVLGTGFGSSGQFIVWFGPRQASPSSCTEANGIFYLKTNGAAYFGGALNAGVITVPMRNTSTAASIDVTTGNFGSNGHARTVTVSFDATASATIYGACPTGIVTPSARVRLYRGTDASGVLLDTWTINGSYYCSPGSGEFEPGGRSEQISGSFTYVDNTGGTTASYYALMDNRVFNMGSPASQSLNVISVEQ